MPCICKQPGDVVGFTIEKLRMENFSVDYVCYKFSKSHNILISIYYVYRGIIKIYKYSIIKVLVR